MSKCGCMQDAHMRVRVHERVHACMGACVRAYVKYLCVVTLLQIIGDMESVSLSISLYVTTFMTLLL